MPATLASAEPRRARGRPRRLTPEAVLDAALTLFEDEPAAEFTLGRLARRLGVPITSLYTCFPNRDALLDAAADRVFARFDWKPEPRRRGPTCCCRGCTRCSAISNATRSRSSC